MTQLIKYDAMCTAIQACVSVDEVKDIRDKALALEAYAKQAMNTEAERKATAVRLRAERRAGEMLAEKERNQGANNQYASIHGEVKQSEYKQALIDSNVSPTQAHRWQKLAAVDPMQFEDALNDPVKAPSTSGIIKKANGQNTQMAPDALWLWGRLRDFERDNISGKKAADLLGEMTTAMQADISRIAPVVIDYLQELLEETNG